MRIDFKKLQQAFIEEIKADTGVVLRWHDVSFDVQPKFELADGKVTVTVRVFDELYSLGYAGPDTNESLLLADIDSRLHDYGEKADWYIVKLRADALGKEYADQIQQLREAILCAGKGLQPTDFGVDISDFAPSEKDERGFPKFGLFVDVHHKSIAVKELDPMNYNHRLADEMLDEIIGKLPG